MNIKSTKSIPKTAQHICVMLGTSSSVTRHPHLSKFKEYLKGKLKDKKSQIIRLIDGEVHYIAIIVHKDSSHSFSKYYEALRKLGNEVCHKLEAEGAENVYFTGAEDILQDEELVVFLEGMLLGSYSFDKYKSKKKTNALKNVFIQGNIKPASLKELKNTAESTCFARDLVNEPVIHLNSVQMGREIAKWGKKCGFSVKLLNKATIEKLKMGGLLGVNMGSVDPPVFAIMEWKSPKAKNKKPYVLVGKGVVYDTGGNNLKIGNYMPTMKSDMGGAAAVIGTMGAVSKNNLPLHVVGLVPITDNRIGKNALVPDDVIKISDGTTVEVLNTDAEGRLILSDALVYAKKYSPKLVIDLATLTGAAAAITGSFGSAFMGTADEKIKYDLKSSGDMVYERLAEMPYWDEYNDLLKSNVADIKNIGGPTGGVITAGKFLETFTDYPWIHIDIAGPAFLKQRDSYRTAGGTGVGVRLLYHFLKSKSVK